MRAYETARDTNDGVSGWDGRRDDVKVCFSI